LVVCEPHAGPAGFPTVGGAACVSDRLRANTVVIAGSFRRKSVDDSSNLRLLGLLMEFRRGRQ